LPQPRPRRRPPDAGHHHRAGPRATPPRTHRRSGLAGPRRHRPPRRRRTRRPRRDRPAPEQTELRQRHHRGRPGTSPARRPAPRWFVHTLIYAALTSSIVSSLGMLLVPSVASEFDVPVSTAQWMLTINLLVGAVATPIMGRLADGPHTR